MFQPRYPWQVPWWRRFTLQSAVMVGAAAFVLAYPIYDVLDRAISHGIHRQGDLLLVDMKAMSDFDFDQVNGQTGDIPKPFRQLDGQRVMMAGQIVPTNSAAGAMDRFQLCYSIANCCFSGPPRVQHFVYATVLPGRRVEYSGGVVNVVGTLHVGVERADGQVSSVYRMDVEKVE
jgi:hypothetical protein